MSPNLSSKMGVKQLIQRHNVYPSIKLGQNFLIDRSVIRKFLKAADLASGDLVLEIGPGIGNLTREIAKKVRKVIAIEKDPKLIRILNEELRIKNVEVIEGDVLKILHSTFHIPRPFKVVANLPFYLTSPVIRQFLERWNVRPSTMTLIVQKEVAQRICSRPPKMNFLAVLVQFYGEPKIISYISKRSFWPQPKVDTAILRITQIRTDEKTDSHRFFKIVSAGFSQPRKQLVNNLARKLKLDKKEIAIWLEKNKIQPAQRAETLSIKDWIALTESYQSFCS